MGLQLGYAIIAEGMGRVEHPPLLTRPASKPTVGPSHAPPRSPRSYRGRCRSAEALLLPQLRRLRAPGPPTGTGSSWTGAFVLCPLVFESVVVSCV